MDQKYFKNGLRLRPNSASPWTLRMVGDARAVGPLIQTLRDKNRLVRFPWGAAALELTKDERTVEQLTWALKDEHEMVRKAAKEALEKIKAKAKRSQER